MFTGVGRAEFGEGCFWHHCAERGSGPRVGARWQDAILSKNVDRDTDAGQLEVGWTLLRLWDHVTPVSAAGTVDATHLRLMTVAGRAITQIGACSLRHVAMWDVEFEVDI